MSDLRQSLREYATKLTNSREYQRGAPDMRQHGDRMLAECLTFENELLADRDRLAAELAAVRAEVEKYRGYEHIEAHKNGVPRVSWYGARYKMPAGYVEVSNESGLPPSAGSSREGASRS